MPHTNLVWPYRTTTVGVGALPIIKKNFLSAGPETRRKRSVCSRASKCSIERVPYLIFDKVMGIWKSPLLYVACREPGCIGKSNTNNLPAPTDLTENPYGKKKLVFNDATQKSASMVACKRNCNRITTMEPDFWKMFSSSRKRGGADQNLAYSE